MFYTPQEACRQVAAWQNASSPTPFVSVNFSSRQIEQSDLVPCVEQVLKETAARRQTSGSNSPKQ